MHNNPAQLSGTPYRRDASAPSPDTSTVPRASSAGPSAAAAAEWPTTKRDAAPTAAVGIQPSALHYHTSCRGVTRSPNARWWRRRRRPTCVRAPRSGACVSRVFIQRDAVLGTPTHAQETFSIYSQNSRPPPRPPAARYDPMCSCARVVVCAREHRPPPPSRYRAIPLT